MIATKRSAIAGNGAFATRAYKKGEKVMMLTGKRMNARGVDRLIEAGKLRIDDPYELGDGTYLVLDHTPLMANHSCNPNTGIRGKNQLIALRAIRRGEEITYDYSTVVGDTASDESPWTMRCRCGAKTCRRKVGNWRTLPTPRLALYRRNDVLPTFIKKLDRAHSRGKVTAM